MSDTNFVFFERLGCANRESIGKEEWPKNCCVVGIENGMSLFGAISSTEVRSRISRNIGIYGLVTPSVIKYNNDHQLYK